MSIFYDRTQIEAWLDPYTLAKAHRYVPAVSQLYWQRNTLYGKVQGTARRPYTLQVHFQNQQAKRSMQGHCSCPVGNNCKHVAALLLAALDRQPTPQPGIRAELIAWLENFRRRNLTPSNAKSIHILTYRLSWNVSLQQYSIVLFKAVPRMDGTLRSMGTPWYNAEKALVQPPQFVLEQDITILRALCLGCTHADEGAFVVRGTLGAEVLQKIVATGRFFTPLLHEEFDPDPGQVLHPGPPRSGQLRWLMQSNNQLCPVLQTEPEATLVLATLPPWYIDTQTSEAGTIELSHSLGPLADYLFMPAISLAEAPLVAAALRELVPDLPLPPVYDASALRVIDTDPVPCLLLDTQPMLISDFNSHYYGATTLDFVSFTFDYDGVSLNTHHNETLCLTADERVIQVKRRPEVEKQHLRMLYQTGFRFLECHPEKGLPHIDPETIMVLAAPEAWDDFVDRTLPRLRDKGWRIEMTTDFRFNVLDIEAIEGAIQPAEQGWFLLEMGITVGDRSVRLEPLLADLFRRDRRWLQGKLDQIADDDKIELKTEQGERLRLSAHRLKPIVRVLIDLLDNVGQAPLRFSVLDAGRLAALQDTGRWQFHGDESIRQLAHCLQQGGGMQTIAAPTGLQAQLRPYQQQGLSWMQFLRTHNLSGVLADDMGLGKTIQTLAHILVEKQAGRLDRPVLVVMPTTLVHNWLQEASRFAPDLKVLALNGSQRKRCFDTLDQHDLILTTYALIWRDHSVLAQQEYHLLILDEAQYVKNAKSQAATTLRALRARHRLCLTGTPLENHLGEIWSQFDFLLPGFLGSQKMFTQRWRTPIEKGGDSVRHALLSRRLRPFMLRRRKDEVATELPPKTTIIRKVDFGEAQRDLYETVHAAMQEKVREAIAAQGLAKSQLVVLDALLKLRQVCCDPRLVKLKSTHPSKASAKLDLLKNLLPELLDEGRRILLFSQFTAMLSLIAAELEQAAIPYVTLTGETTDRVTPVQRFQQGEVALFLISLKAGGVGLNLTAADVVIHYDPWWNPAAEDQATDRAHRLGQDKPVFVYKLIISGSIEEKIIALQEKKAALADSILSDNTTGEVKFSREDLAALLETC